MDLYLLNNYYGILHTVEVISSKLYVNWINVRPITLDTCKAVLFLKNEIYLKNGQVLFLLIVT